MDIGPWIGLKLWEVRGHAGHSRERPRVGSRSRYRVCIAGGKEHRRVIGAVVILEEQPSTLRRIYIALPIADTHIELLRFDSLVSVVIGLHINRPADATAMPSQRELLNTDPPPFAARSISRPWINSPRRSSYLDNCSRPKPWSWPRCPSRSSIVKSQSSEPRPFSPAYTSDP